MILLAAFHGFATHMDPIVFLILVGISLLFRLLTGKKQKPDRSDETAPPAVRRELPPREMANSDEERIRRFLEALGQPQSAEPPPPVIPRPAATFPEPPAPEARARTIRPRRNLLNPLPPLTTTPPPLSKSVPLPRQVSPSPYEAKPFVPPTPETPPFEVRQEESAARANEPAASTGPADAYALAAAPRAVGAQASQFVLDLRAPGALQRAIILREIFGPPRSLAPLEIG